MPKTAAGEPSQLKKIGTTVATLVTLLGALSGVWKSVLYVGNLHDTIRSNEEKLDAFAETSQEQHEAIRQALTDVATHLEEQRERDNAQLVQLRIAVAAIQAAQNVRAGRTGYSGTESLFSLPEAPTSSRERRAQAGEAEEDATEALNLALEIADHDLPAPSIEALLDF